MTAASVSIAGATVPLPVILGGLAAFLVVRKLVAFFMASCDLQLLSKRDPPSRYYEGKVVWIVGASQGLGRALAVMWASQGARLVLSSRNRDSLERLKENLVGTSGAFRDADVAIVPLDITDEFDSVQGAADDAFAAFGGIDYVVYNAGASQHARVEETRHDVAIKLVEMNLLGQMAVARAILPRLLQQGHGHHVVVASMAALVPSPGQAVYAAGKSAVRAYFLSMASELYARGIRVSVVCPGPVDAGTDGDSASRKVYGCDGLMEQKNKSKSGARVSLGVFAKLTLRAVYHELDEVMITNHPVLLMGYLTRYIPAVAMRILKKVGPGRVRQLETGSGTGYDVSSMVR
jgi:dehydrogenase/reductase SDR family protein 7